MQLGPATLTTDSAGGFSVERASMTDTIQVEANGYQTGQARVWPPREQHLNLVPRGFGLHVRDAETNEPIADAVAVAPGIRAQPTEPGRFQVEPARDNMFVTVSAPASAMPSCGIVATSEVDGRSSSRA